MMAALSDRRRLALCGLALPILGMFGLLGWAGSVSETNPLSPVTSFLAAWNKGDCSAVVSDLESADPTGPRITCDDVFPPGHRTLVTCRLRPAVPTGERAPVKGVANIELVVATCRERPAPGSTGTPEYADLDFYVGLSVSTGREIFLGVRSPGP